VTRSVSCRDAGQRRFGQPTARPTQLQQHEALDDSNPSVAASRYAIAYSFQLYVASNAGSLLRCMQQQCFHCQPAAGLKLGVCMTDVLASIAVYADQNTLLVDYQVSDTNFLNLVLKNELLADADPCVPRVALQS
jgi:hypothetical protein